ncbi:MAG: DMT family transporter [Ahrensia sp.]|nr:DMT family transporter [Ahrensia sp.]
MRRSTANILLLFVGAIWGMGFVAQSTAMETIEPVFFTGIRFLAGALAVLPFAIWEYRKQQQSHEHKATQRFKQALPGYILIGTILFTALVTQQFGLMTTTVTNSGFLTGLYVVITPILSVIIFRQAPHWIIWPAAALTLLGIFLLAGGRLTNLNTGDLWILLCALLWACHVLALGRVLANAGQSAQPFTLACTQFFVCAILGLAIAFVFETPTLKSVIDAGPEILFTGVISGGLAFTLQALAQRQTTAPQAAIFMSSEALFAALFGAIILGERIGIIGIIGCGLMFSAMLIVEIVPALRKKTLVQI